MTADERPHTVEENLAFLRRIAEEGRLAVGLSGDYLILWGVVMAAAYANHYLIESAMSDRMSLVGAGYGVAVALGWAGTAALTARDRKRSGARAIGVRIFAAVFASSGLAMTIFAVIAATQPAIRPELNLVVGALMFGSCFLSTGLLSRLNWLAAVGAAWLAAAIAFAALLDHPSLMIVAAGLWAALNIGSGAALRIQNRRRSRVVEPATTGLL